MVLELLGLKISWFPICVGVTEVTTKLGLPQLALELILEEKAYLGMAWSLSIPITFPVVRKMLAHGCPASVTFAYGRDV